MRRRCLVSFVLAPSLCCPCHNATSPRSSARRPRLLMCYLSLLSLSVCGCVSTIAAPSPRHVFPCFAGYSCACFLALFPLCCPSLHHVFPLVCPWRDVIFRYSNFEPIGDGSYGFVCSADDRVRFLVFCTANTSNHEQPKHSRMAGVSRGGDVAIAGLCLSPSLRITMGAMVN